MQITEGQVLMAQGRIVWTSGDLFKGQLKTEFNSKQPKLNAQGEQVREYGFGLAIPKTALQDTEGTGKIWTAMHQEAQKLFPNIPPSFSMKYKDGDSIDNKGVSYAQREGYAGHIVVACTTTLPIRFFKYENGQNILINEGIKCGDYVNVQLQVKAHGAIGQGKPGLYINPLAVQFLGYGKEIVNTPSGDNIFGNSMPTVPQGASATPIAPQGMIVPNPVTPSAVAPTPGAPTPNYGVLPQAHQPAPQGYAQSPQGFPQPAPVAPAATPNVGGMPMPPGFGQ